MRKKIRERSIFFIFIQEDGGSQEKQSIFIEDILLERDVDAKERRNVVVTSFFCDTTRGRHSLFAARDVVRRLTFKRRRR